MKALKTFIKPFEVPQRSVTIKILSWFFSLRPGSGREGLIRKWTLIHLAYLAKWMGCVLKFNHVIYAFRANATCVWSDKSWCDMRKTRMWHDKKTQSRVFVCKRFLGLTFTRITVKMAQIIATWNENSTLVGEPFRSYKHSFNWHFVLLIKSP